MYKDITNSIEEKVGFDLIEASSIVNVPSVREIKEESKDYSKMDYEFARDNIHSLVEKSMTAVDSVISLLRESESPRAIEAASAFFKCISELNKDLVSLSPTSKTSSVKSKDDVQNNTVNNNAIFIGSSEDLSEMIKMKLNNL